MKYIVTVKIQSWEKSRKFKKNRRILTDSQLWAILGPYNFRTVYPINLQIFGALNVVVENMWKEYEDR